MPNDYRSIPAEMRAADRWLCWMREPDPKHPDKPRKVPAQARRIGLRASSTDRTTWGSFAEARAALHRESSYAGLGFALGDGIAGVDIDHCVDLASGHIAEWAQAIIDTLDSYTEFSPSGAGVHIIVRGALPKGRRKTGPLEMYSAGRYFTVTGRHVPGTPTTIYERTGELAALHARTFPEEDRTARILPFPRVTTDDELHDALAAIPPDDRELWLRVGMALHAHDPGDCGFALWTAWSRRSDKFDENDQRYTWKHFHGDGGIGLPTVFYLARQCGWRPKGHLHRTGNAWTAAAERARLEASRR